MLPSFLRSSGLASLRSHVSFCDGPLTSDRAHCLASKRNRRSLGGPSKCRRRRTGRHRTGAGRRRLALHVADGARHPATRLRGGADGQFGAGGHRAGRLRAHRGHLFRVGRQYHAARRRAVERHRDARGRRAIRGAAERAAAQQRAAHLDFRRDRIRRGPVRGKRISAARSGSSTFPATGRTTRARR